MTGESDKTEVPAPGDIEFSDLSAVEAGHNLG
jgi:hypothetical protein